MIMVWNPWHGCYKLSEGCRNCYVYRMDERYKRDATLVKKTGSFDLPIKRMRDGSYKIPSGKTLYTCFTSDFFLEKADEWRIEAWKMIRERFDLKFFMITKRIDRFLEVIPEDWGDGYPNVSISCTIENQDRADYRIPFFKEAPIKHKDLICEPLLEAIDLRSYLGSWLEGVVIGGESGPNARYCSMDWVMDIRQQCIDKDVPFQFRQTGAKLVKNKKIYNIPRRSQLKIARKLNIDTA
jgi:protein gp37